MSEVTPDFTPAGRVEFSSLTQSAGHPKRKRVGRAPILLLLVFNCDQQLNPRRRSLRKESVREPVMGVANQLYRLEIVKELYDLIFPPNETVRDATYLGWGPEESVAHEDYLKQLSSLRRRPEMVPTSTAPDRRKTKKPETAIVFRF
jgi:hypothetical protein